MALTSSIQVVRNVCANTKSEKGGHCVNAGNLACKSCLLVSYCGVDCQKAHWPDHKRDCKAEMTKPNWKPGWLREERSPAFMDTAPRLDTADHPTFGTQKYLWGNVPAQDIVKLSDNEGVCFSGPLNLLFAASGDIRNIVMSVAALPKDYEGETNIVINDKDFDVVARNVILLLSFMTVDDAQTAAENAVHLFYSAFITKDCFETLNKNIKPLVADVCGKVAHKPGGKLLGKTWKFGCGSLRLVLTKDEWMSLLGLFTVPEGLTKAVAHEARLKITWAPERIDYIERYLIIQEVGHRVGFVKFRHEGLLLPFGHPRGEFEIPNPTIFKTKDEWPMMDSADPQNGWEMKTVLTANYGPAPNDVYGKLYHFLVDLFKQFHGQLRNRSLSFQLHRQDAREIAAHLPGMKFARIDASNIADGGYVGIKETLSCLGGLLQDVGANPHATLLTMFLNAVYEVLHQPGRDDQRVDILLRKVMEYMPTQPMVDGPAKTQINIMRHLAAIECVRDCDLYFEEYQRALKFCDLGKAVGLAMKETHSIVPVWPMRFGFGPPTEEAKKDIARLVASTYTGQERYVEWKVAGCP